MKKTVHCLLLSLLVLHIVNTTCYAFSIKKDDQQWLGKNLIVPEANLIFIVTVNRAMLEQQSDSSTTTQVVDYSSMTDDEIKKQIEENQLKAEAYVELYQRLQRQGKYQQGNQVLSIALTRILGKLEQDSSNWLLVDETIKIYQAAHQQMRAKKLLGTFLDINSHNIDAMLVLANLEILSANFPIARTLIDRAYDQAPFTTDIYIAEFLYQLYFGLVELNKMPGQSKLLTLPVSTHFFIKAAQDNPAAETPRVMQHGLQVLQVFYSSILRNMDKFIGKRAFDFVVDDQLERKLLESKSFFRQSIKDGKTNYYFSKLCLLMAAVIENDQTTANRLYKELAVYPAADNNIHRLMVIHDISKAHFSEAIQHLATSIKQHDNAEDRVMLASLYRVKSNNDLSLNVLMDYSGSLTMDLLVNRLGYSLLADNIEHAVQLYSNYKNIKPLWQSPQFIYYSLIVELLQGEQQSANDRLQDLVKEDELYRNGQLFIQRFGQKGR